MTVKEMIVFATGVFLGMEDSDGGYFVNFLFKDDEGHTRRETLFAGLTQKEAGDIVRNLNKARRIVAGVAETYESNLF